MAAEMDIKQINKNRRIMAECSIASPIVPTIEDCDADYGERLYDQLPPDKVGYLPPGTRE
jgi:hypothetical protein